MRFFYVLLFLITNITFASPSTPIKNNHKKNILPQKINSPHIVQTNLRSIIIVIDPGHGGHDPGATGMRGTHEKEVVLRIAKQLQSTINTFPGFKAYLTRQSDYYVTLRQRLRLARRYKADFFIAIHADAYKRVGAQGATLFALSLRGATSEAARWLAKQENASELMGGVELIDKDYLLKRVLLNLSQSATIQSSLLIGEQLMIALSNITSLHHHRVEQAAFVVLKSPDIPSLLVETGFISNPLEESKLNNSLYERNMASALASGIKKYFQKNPPRGTWLGSV